MNTNETTPAPAPASQAEFTFKPYDSQLPIAVGKGMRLVKCLYKGKKVAGVLQEPARPNEYVVVPDGHLSEQVMVDQAAKLAPYVAAFFQSEEDKLIKEAHKNHSKGFGSSWFSLEKILEALDSAGQGSRLTKDDVENWFTSEVELPLGVAFSEKLGFGETPTEEQLNQLTAILEGYKAKFAALAGGKTAYLPEEVEKLEKVLTITGKGTSTPIGSKLVTRLEGMKSKEGAVLVAL